MRGEGQAPAAQPWIERLDLKDFRNHAALSLDLSPGLVVLTGDNGAGKTNVLEAVSLLAPGRGLRRSTLGEMARSGGPGRWAVAARLGDGTALGTGTGGQGEGAERRRVRINGAFQPATQLSDHLTVQWLTPAMDRLWVEGASGRRRWLDRMTLALFPAHATHASRYEAAMRERTRLLTGDDRPDPDWLSALEARMVEHGRLLHTSRTELLTGLAELLATGADDVFARPQLALSLEGCGCEIEQLARNRSRDAAAGRALEGPHRLDLLATHRDTGQAASSSSTGEQKAMLLSVQLAHGDLIARVSGRWPVLLLDEVAAHLDPDRRAALFGRLASWGQVWMSGTEPGLFGTAEPATHLTF